MACCFVGIITVIGGDRRNALWRVGCVLDVYVEGGTQSGAVWASSPTEMVERGDEDIATIKKGKMKNDWWVYCFGNCGDVGRRGCDVVSEMEGRKMTMKQIIESLEICNGDNEKGCESCSLFGRVDCGMHLQREALALIREQKASILRHKCRIRLLESDVSTAKYDAVKEFAKLLIDSSKDEEINVSDIPDYVVEYLEGGSDE